MEANLGVLNFGAKEVCTHIDLSAYCRKLKSKQITITKLLNMEITRIQNKKAKEISLR